MKLMISSRMVIGVDVCEGLEEWSVSHSDGSCTCCAWEVHNDATYHYKGSLTSSSLSSLSWRFCGLKSCWIFLLQER